MHSPLFCSSSNLPLRKPVHGCARSFALCVPSACSPWAPGRALRLLGGECLYECTRHSKTRREAVPRQVEALKTCLLFSTSCSPTTDIGFKAHRYAAHVCKTLHYEGNLSGIGGELALDGHFFVGLSDRNLTHEDQGQNKEASAFGG